MPPLSASPPPQHHSLYFQHPTNFGSLSFLHIRDPGLVPCILYCILYYFLSSLHKVRHARHSFTMHPVSLLALLAAAGASAGVTPRQSAVNQAVIPKSFGVTAGQGRDQVQVGSCTGANNKLIPCYCPPAPNSPDFLGKLSKALTAGFIFSKEQVALPITLAEFNNAGDTSIDTNKRRATAMIQVLQNFNLTIQGVGCPGVSAPVLGIMQLTGQTNGDASSLGNSG